MKLPQISIVGSGWLGGALATVLAEDYTIHISTTSVSKVETLKAQGFTPFVFSLGSTTNTHEIPSFLEGSDIIIINFPPKRRIDAIETVYPQQVSALLPFIKEHQKVLFISSTSVYQNTNDWVTESLPLHPEKASGLAVRGAEQALQEALQERLTILRFSGLIGYDRLPGRFLANKKELRNGKSPVNVIHRDDCIGLIQRIIETESWGEIFNGCSDEHPTREHFYTLAATRLGLTAPEFVQEQTPTNFKLISNRKSKEKLAYVYKFPDPLKLI